MWDCTPDATTLRKRTARRLLFSAPAMPNLPPEDLTRLMRKAAHVPGLISFAGGLPAPETFPREQLAHAAHDVIAGGDPSALQYEWPEGRQRLRATIARRLQARGVKVTQDELVITNGAQDALAMTLQVLQPKEVRVDRQTYPG